ncbi:DNA recombination protein RmuC [Nitrospira sp. Kam-Ns4a]
MDLTSFSIGLVAGLIVGALVAGLWAATRLRAQAQPRLVETAERAQRAEAVAAELRKQIDAERGELARLRGELDEARQARAVAETRCEDTLKSLAERTALLAQARQELADAFKALSGEALKSNNEAFLDLARASFEALQAEAKSELARHHQAIDEAVRPLQEALKRYEEQLLLLEQSRQSAYGGLDQHLKLLAESHQRLQQETGNLVKALRSPVVRGRWGELTLKRVVELAGLVEHCDFIEQESVETDEGRQRPDLLVQLPNGHQIVVDAKAVLAAYLEAHEAADEAQRLAALRRHAAQIRAHIEQLGAKAYWAQFPQAPEFVVLFLPGEQFLGAALEQDPTLIEDGFARSVVLATPTTLIALLRAVAYGWRQERLSRHAEQAGRLGKELFERMAVLAEHLAEVGLALSKSVQSYNRAVGSLEARVLPAARKFKELGIATDKDLPPLEPIETGPRQAPALEAD